MIFLLVAVSVCGHSFTAGSQQSALHVNASAKQPALDGTKLGHQQEQQPRPLGIRLGPAMLSVGIHLFYSLS